MFIYISPLKSEPFIFLKELRIFRCTCSKHLSDVSGLILLNRYEIIRKLSIKLNSIKSFNFHNLCIILIANSIKLLGEEDLFITLFS